MQGQLVDRDRQTGIDHAHARRVHRQISRSDRRQEVGPVERDGLLADHGRRQGAIAHRQPPDTRSEEREDDGVGCATGAGDDRVYSLERSTHRLRNGDPKTGRVSVEADQPPVGRLDDRVDRADLLRVGLCKALELFAQRGYPQELIDAVAGHATFLGVPRETQMAKTLFAVDELSRLHRRLRARAPDRIDGMTPKSVKKKLKQPSFAAGVNRDEVREGAEELGVDFDEHVAFVIGAMEERADELGLAAAA